MDPVNPPGLLMSEPRNSLNLNTNISFASSLSSSKPGLIVQDQYEEHKTKGSCAGLKRFGIEPKSILSLSSLGATESGEVGRRINEGREARIVNYCRNRKGRTTHG